MSEYAHPSLGTVRIVRSERAHRLTLSVRASGEIRLTIPRGMNEREALRFLDEKQAWAERTRARFAARLPHETIGMPYSTRKHTLRLEPCACIAATARIDGELIRIRYPADMNYADEPVQETIRRGIEQAWRIEAQQYLPGRVAELCRELGFRCGKVTVRNSRTRWGSCSSRNDLSLSLHLMKLPDRLIDYILIHELCHTAPKSRPRLPCLARSNDRRQTQAAAKRAERLFDPVGPMIPCDGFRPFSRSCTGTRRAGDREGCPDYVCPLSSQFACRNKPKSERTRGSGNGG